MKLGKELREKYEINAGSDSLKDKDKANAK